MAYQHNSCYIDGKWENFKNKGKIAVYNPSSNEIIGSVPNLGTEETKLAIEAAHRAFSAWSKTTSITRAVILKRIAFLLMQNIEDLALLLTKEQGKPLKEAKDEIAYGASYFEWFAEEARRIYGQEIPAPAADRRIFISKEPVGVCAFITPWNFPNAMPARKIAAALAAGCAVIVKPAPETPYSALALADIGHQAGVPAGVLNIITGDAEPIAAELMESQLVRKISFTGSTEVGKILIRQSAGTLKKLTLELGGNAPFIVFDDADIDAAIIGAVKNKFRNCGQTCISANRFLVHTSLTSQFKTRLISEVQKLKIGDGLLAETQLGPLISQEAKEKINSLISDALQKGSTIDLKGNEQGGLFQTPWILSGINSEMNIWNEEIFGPLVAIREFSTEEEAIALANSTTHGLAAYFYSKGAERIARVSRSLEFGMLGINNIALSCAEAPFGGIKESGFGREGGQQGIEEYLNLKYISTAN